MGLVGKLIVGVVVVVAVLAFAPKVLENDKVQDLKGSLDKLGLAADQAVEKALGEGLRIDDAHASVHSREVQRIDLLMAFEGENRTQALNGTWLLDGRDVTAQAWDVVRDTDGSLPANATHGDVWRLQLKLTEGLQGGDVAILRWYPEDGATMSWQLTVPELDGDRVALQIRAA